MDEPMDRPFGQAASGSGEPTAVCATTTDRPRDSFHDPARGNASWFTLFSADLTPTSAMSAGVMELPARGGSLAPHRHRQPEIYHVLEGTGQLTVSGVTMSISAGTSAFIPGDAEHALRNEASEPLKIFYVFPTDSFAEIVYRFS